MSDITPLICRVATLNDMLRESLEKLVSHSDSEEYALAGIELGRIVQIGSELAAMEYDGSNALCREMRQSWEKRK